MNKLKIKLKSKNIKFRSIFIFGFSMSLSVLLATPAKALVLNMAPLEFSNRAACADLSTKPTRSVFLQIDALNAGKAGHALALGLNEQNGNQLLNPVDFREEAVKKFRLLSTQLTTQIAEALLNGRLPLLPPDGSSPDLFRQTVEKCLNKNELLSCKAMNDLLSEIWDRSKMDQPHFEELGFLPTHFFPADLSKSTAFGCHIIRKFSAFQSHLKSQVVTNGIIDSIAMDAFKPEDNLDSCFADAEGKDPRFTTVQIDLARLEKEAAWDTLGFPFWHSLKLFLSWAWRNAPEYQEQFGKFNQLFPKLAYEDSIMLIPNGCRSVEMPRCDSVGLASDTMRAAKYLGLTHPAIEQVPPKPIDTLFEGKALPINSDVMGVFKAEDASAWARDFQKNIFSLRGVMMMKLNTSLAKLRTITTLVDAKSISEDINTILADPAFDNVETYLACTEYNFAKNNFFDDIYQEIQTLSKTDELKSVLLSDSGIDLKAFVLYYQKLSETMEPFCLALEKNPRTRTSVPNIQKSLNEWAFDLSHPNERSSYASLCTTNPSLTCPQCVNDPKQPACPQNLDKKFLVTRSNQSQNDQDEITVCKTSLECARIVLDSLISVVSVRRYAHAFLPLDDVIKSPQLFNTYAAPVACKLYDPWSKQRSSWKLFVANLGSALLSGASCGAFNFQTLDLPKNNVVGFNEILENNQTSYDPKIERTPLKYIAGVDYSFLPGFSCGASVTNYVLADAQRNYIMPGYTSVFSVKSCNGKSEIDYKLNDTPQVILHDSSQTNPALKTVLTGKDITSIKTCYTCAIEFTSLAKYSCFTTPAVAMPIIAGIGIFQGVMQLISNLSDPDNIPRSSQLNVDQISQSFSDMKTVTNSCHRRLKKGKTCR